jgi:hypothetical protein
MRSAPDRVAYAGGYLMWSQVGAERVYRDGCDGPSSEEARSATT